VGIIKTILRLNVFHEATLTVVLATLLLAGLLIGSNAKAQTNPIDPSRRTDWSQAGIPGGIVHRTNICATFGPGATTASINGAIAACNNGVVYLSAGTYNVSSLTFIGKSNITLRGAGPEQTIVKFSGADSCNGLWADVCVRGASSVWTGNVLPLGGGIANWTGGYVKGATQITLDSTAGLTVGQVIVLDQLDDTTDTGGIVVSFAPGFTIEGSAPGRPGPRSQQQYVKVTAISGNQVTISPGLHMPNWRAAKSPQAWWWGGPSQTAMMIGIEDLTLDHSASGATSGVSFFNAYTGWLKNIKSLNAGRNHVWLSQAARIEVRDSYFYGTKNAASQSYGVESLMTSDDLVVNNIFHHVTSPIMMGPSSGSVYAYNYMIDMYYYISTWMAEGIVGGHDAGNAMNLFEGNVGNGFLMDLFHGTGNLATLFRNQFSGIEPGKTQSATIPIDIYAYNRFVNIVGNVLGTRGHHTQYEESLVPPGVHGGFHTSIYSLGYPDLDFTSYNGVSYDRLTVTTMLRWGNFDYVTNTSRFEASEVPTGNPLPADRSLPASLFMSSKPAFWGTVPWPPIGPEVVGGQDPAGHAHKIPAQVCFESRLKYPDGTAMFNARDCYGSLSAPAPSPSPEPVPAPAPAPAPASIPSGSTTFWNTLILPSLISSSDTQAVELGVKFSSSVPGKVLGVRFYKGPENTGMHVGHLWSALGVLLAQAAFVSETASGWQQVLFATSVDVLANTTYVVSYHAPVGRYSQNVDYFVSTLMSGSLTAPSSAVAGGNGVYSYGASAFPTQSYQSSNYWVDVVFVAASAPTPAPAPTPTPDCIAKGKSGKCR
jgi:hypothetical protein